MTGTTAASYVAPRYNFRVPVKNGMLLYNAKSGALLRVDGPDAVEVTQLLVASGTEVDAEDFSGDFWEQVVEGNFLVAVELLRREVDRPFGDQGRRGDRQDCRGTARSLRQEATPCRLVWG